MLSPRGERENPLDARGYGLNRALTCASVGVMQCPRCQQPTARVEMPTPDGGSAWIERCNTHKSCGYWFDGGTLPALHPSFAQTEVSDALFLAPAVEEAVAQRVKCPRCPWRVEMSAVRFVGITLDRCVGCRGVWVDRDEYAALLHALQLHASEEKLAPTHYRSAAVQTTMSRKPGAYATCVACKVEVPYGEAMFTERGLMCFACGTKYAQQD